MPTHRSSVSGNDIWQPISKTFNTKTEKAQDVLAIVLTSPSTYKPISDATTIIAVQIATLTGKASQVMTTPIGRGFFKCQ